MATPSFSDEEFLLGWCGNCGKEVLPYVEIDAGDREVRRCLHCDAVLDHTLHGATAVQVQEAGYQIVEARTCGNGGGCSSGCGMRSTPERAYH